MMRVPRLVSVVVPAYDAGPALLEQLAALDAQEGGVDFEVVVADNGSRDGSVTAAREWMATRGGRPPEMRVLDASGARGPGPARNAGARAARGDLLAFCDADDVVGPSWLAELVATATRADLVGGRLDAELLNDPRTSACHDLTDPALPHLGFLPIAAGANMAVWAEVLWDLGGFPDSRTGEDVELIWRAQLAGRRFRASQALVHKRLPSTPADTAKRFFGYGLGDARLYRRFGAAGMPRRSRQETLTLWRGLATGLRAVPAGRRRRTWVIVAALSAGRLVGCARHRVVFP